jgi:DNA-binding MarR family transcriptional regulator
MATTPTTERPVHPVAKELVASSGFLMARLGMAFKTSALERIEAEGFEANHYGVLAIVAEGAPETQATIADSLGLDPSRLVAVLDSLERRDLIARQRDPHDRRRHVVSITAEGKRKLERLRAIAKELEDEFFGLLDADDRKTLHRLLSELACAHDPRCAFARDSSPKPG